MSAVPAAETGVPPGPSTLLFGESRDGQLGTGSLSAGTAREPVPVPGLGPAGLVFVNVSLGARHSAAVTADGALYTWGAGHDYQLGHGDNRCIATPTRVAFFAGETVRTVACGRLMTVAVTVGNAVYTWGDGARGVLGHPKSFTDMLAWRRRRPTLGVCKG
jgi:alpha-tubulin suppressor-like RCC1 family protein